MSEPICILYNDTCPICSREVAVYVAQARAAAVPLQADPLQAAPDWGMSPDMAARRFHLRQGGQVLSGMAAFRAIWARLPGWGWLAWATALPVVAPLVDWLYDHVAAPALYAAHLRRQRRRTNPTE